MCPFGWNVDWQMIGLLIAIVTAAPFMLVLLPVIFFANFKLAKVIGSC
jgi:hypothetical protein